MQWLERLTALAWGPVTLGLFLFVGGYYSVRSGFFQLFGIRRWLGNTLFSGTKGTGRDGLSPLQTLSTALAATMGTGSIAGVAAAVTAGGAGAVLWMWVAAFFSMMTGWAEKALAVKCRCRNDGVWQGGPIYWLERRGHQGLALWFAVSTACAALGMGCAVQSNSVAAAVTACVPVEPLAVGLVLAVLTACVLFGGLQRIGSVCERLVPGMAVLFLLGGCVVLVRFHRRIPAALTEILQGAFTVKAAAGGGFGTLLRVGISRGICTNEAGLGSTPMVHCSAANNDPVTEGFWGIVEVFLSTFLVCSVMALVILVTGADEKTALTGGALSASAFSIGLGRLGGGFVALCLALFAFSTLLGWSWYGCCAVGWLLGEQWKRRYQLLYLCFIVVGSVAEVKAAWLLSDCCNAMMAVPALLALLMYRKTLAPELRQLE